MTIKREYGAVDRFRIIAALLVIAIHTSPLFIFGELPDFIFTRVIARLAVPFFFTATGFFVLGKHSKDPNTGKVPVLKFVKKTLLIYAMSIIFYLPVNLYTHQLTKTTSVLSAITALLFRGTMYHLWYLPASVLGVIIVWMLLKYTTVQVTTSVSILLYIVGLFGDSYYGIIQNIPLVRGLYDVVFHIFGYTRNGLFFAPMFLVVGIRLQKGQRPSKRKSFLGFIISFAFMIAEGLFLHNAKLQIHDSMYIMLPLCLLFLFSFLLQFDSRSNKSLRNIALVVYLIHPMIIIFVRGIAKITRSVPWLVENSILHYIVVCTGSVLFAIFLQMAISHFTDKRKPDSPHRAWIEVSIKALAHNVQILRSILPDDCELMPAVKANAYGLGAVRICQELNMLNITHFCVACLEETVELRKNGIQGEILILGYTEPENLHYVYRYDLTQTIIDLAYAKEIALYKRKLKVHVKIDTGMHRLGEKNENIQNIIQIFEILNLKISGIFTQLGASDSALPTDIQYSKFQIQNFEEALANIEKAGYSAPNPHLQCSYGIINYPYLKYAYVRPGLALYGIVDKKLCISNVPDLIPIFELKCKISLTKFIRQGERVGYGHNFIAPYDMRIAVLTMGYADGLPRSLSKQRGGFLVKGNYAPIIGNICMDQTIIDITQIVSANTGDTATFIGNSGSACISIIHVAEWAGTIPNEIISRLGQRLQIAYI